jgi:hypothetical protein
MRDVEATDLYNVFLVGLHTDPGISSHLTTYGFKYIAKALTSSSKNWEAINQILQERIEAANGLVVVAKITEYNLILSLTPKYEKPFEELLAHIPRLKHIAYIYDGTLAGDFTCFKDDAWVEDWEREREARICAELPPEAVEEYIRRKGKDRRDIDRWHRHLKLKYEKDSIPSLMKGRIEA